ncbi:MAG: STAS/SEC14 domain-containing protein [Candidatus Promineifilaceae bacterium]|nr:STAS/SEC14 domain-containing protein [Candidatus Promineifilaceae bacterium]
MIAVLSGTDRETIGVRIDGRLTEEDYETLKEEIDLRASQTEEPVSLVVEIKQLEGMSVQAFLEDLSMIGYADKLDKMAAISDDDEWELAAKTIGKPIGALMGLDVKHFEPEAKDAAWSWAKA